MNLNLNDKKFIILKRKNTYLWNIYGLLIAEII